MKREPTMTDDADCQVREVLEEVYAAWDANDAEAFARPYAESATATLPGIYLSGRQAIHGTMAMSARRAGRAGRREPRAGNVGAVQAGRRLAG